MRVSKGDCDISGSLLLVIDVVASIGQGDRRVLHVSRFALHKTITASAD
jgi:hypothetical protein